MSHGESHSHDHDLRPWSRIKQLFRPERSDLGVIVVYGVFVALLSLAVPITVEAMVSTVMFGVLVWPIIWLAIILFVCLTLAGLIHAAEAWVIEILQRRLFVRTVAEFATHIPRVKLESLDRDYGPHLVNRFFDVLKVQKAAATLLLDGISIVLAAVVGMIVLALYHPLLLAFDIVLIILLAIIVMLGRGGVRTGMHESHSKYQIAEWLQEMARVPRTFKTGLGPMVATHRADELAMEYIEHRRQHYNIVFRQFLMAIAVHVGTQVTLLTLGGWLVVNRQLTIGQLIASELIIGLVIGSLLKLNKYLDAWYDLCIGVEKLAVVTDLPIERSSGELLREQPQGMKVAVRALCYESGRPLLDGQSWSADPGERIGLTGRAGVGKSLLLDVLAGFREPSSGFIEMDGLDLRDLSLLSVRKQVSVIHGNDVFAGTIAENVRLGRTDIGLAELKQALSAVNLLGAIRNLPEGLDTLLSATGNPLSSSQALRLCIARAIVGAPRLLILDGVLDRLDHTECPELLDALFDRNRPWTLVVVTHQQDVMNRCDRVIGLDAGELPFAEEL